jgi:hypothetical protein
MGKYYSEEEREFEKWKIEHPFLKVLLYILVGPVAIPIAILVIGIQFALYIVSMCGQFLFPILGIYSLIQLISEGNWAAGIFALVVSVYLGVLCNWIYEKIKYNRFF